MAEQQLQQAPTEDLAPPGDEAQVWTGIGFWECDRLHFTGFIAGEHKVEGGTDVFGEGLFAASTAGVTLDLAEAALRAKYES